MRNQFMRCSALLAISIVVVGCSRDPYAGWQEVASAEHKFKVKMPGSPESSKKKMPDGTTSTNWKVELGPDQPFGAFGMAATPARAERIKEEVFDLAIDAFMDKFKDAKLSKESDITFSDNLIGREIEFDVPAKKLIGRAVFVVANGQSYALFAMGEPSWRGWKMTDRFFKSFELVE